MSNQWKMVPVEPNDEMITAGQDQEWTEEVYAAMLAAAPVPPAGDVEVFAYYLHPLGDLEHGRFLKREDAKISDPSKSEHHGTVVLVDRAHVTRLETEVAVQYAKRVESVQEVDRLTAERDGLLAEVEQLREECHQNMQVAASRLLESKFAHSELTKARELLDEAATAVGEYGDSLIGRCNAEANMATLDLERKLRAHQHGPATPIAHNVDESCGQDAEAAKCERCEASTVEKCDEKGCGFLGAGNGAPAAKGEHCGTCSKLNGSSYCDCE